MHESGELWQSDTENLARFVETALLNSGASIEDVRDCIWEYFARKDVWSGLDYVEHPLDVAERYLLVKQVGHRVHEVDRRFMVLQRLGQAPRSILSRWTP